MNHHRLAVIVVATAAVLDVAAGLLFSVIEHVSVGLSLYWAASTATTVGYGDVAPTNTAGRWLAVVVMLTVVPMFAATFSLFTSGLTSLHVKRAENNIRSQLDGRKAQP